MELLNQVFTTALILNDGHEIFARLNAGDDMIDIVDELNNKFGRPRMGKAIRAVGEHWPSHHLEAVGTLVQWALSKLDTDERITIDWKGDADCPETVTKFELRDHRLLIEFAHPPFPLRATA
jgi:hypothetical protein